MSPGLIARPPGMFSVAGTTPTTRIGALEQRDGAHRARDGCAARHVVLHPLHAVGRLDGDAAGVERDAFSDEAEHRPRRQRPADRGETPSAAAARCCRAPRRAAGPSRAASMRSSSRISTSTPPSVASAAARRANSRGVSALPGSFASSRARLLHSPSSRPRSTAADARATVTESRASPSAMVHPARPAAAGRPSCTCRR